MNNQMLEIDTPLKPGVWLIAVVYDGKKIAMTEFLIVPQIADEKIQFEEKMNELQKIWGNYLPVDAKSKNNRRETSFLGVSSCGKEASK